MTILFSDYRYLKNRDLFCYEKPSALMGVVALESTALALSTSHFPHIPRRRWSDKIMGRLCLAKEVKKRASPIIRSTAKWFYLFAWYIKAFSVPRNEAYLCLNFPVLYPAEIWATKYPQWPNHQPFMRSLHRMFSLLMKPCWIKRPSTRARSEDYGQRRRCIQHLHGGHSIQRSIFPTINNNISQLIFHESLPYLFHLHSECVWTICNKLL